VIAAAFLDRDGVLNASLFKGGVPCPPSDLLDVRILPGVKKAIELLHENNYLPVVITNQPDVARGKKELFEIEAINDYVRSETGVSNFYICPHDDADQCRCRKPKPGLIEIAVSKLGIDLSKSFLVGDRWRDIEAGQSLGLPSYFIDYSYNELEPKTPFIRVSSLLEAVETRIGVEIELRDRFPKS
jgi:D-glycero-D-manno-heptose 1,7-bisphosphate phosphatase